LEAGEEREARILAAANQAVDPTAGLQWLPPLSRGLLLLAAAIDVTLWYFVYRALVGDKGENPKSRGGTAYCPVIRIPYTSLSGHPLGAALFEL